MALGFGARKRVMDPASVCLSKSQANCKTKCLTRISSTFAIIGRSDSAGKANGSMPPKRKTIERTDRKTTNLNSDR